MSARDFSVMPVLVVEQEHVSLPRAVRHTGGSVRAGDRVDVEFGACWGEGRHGLTKVPGQWRACVVVRVVHSELHVEIAPALRQVPVCHCDEGWVCEAHPDQPLGHDDCGGAGMQCTNPDCPWWKGAAPAAMNNWDTIHASTTKKPGHRESS
jgi:hypothetical protein